MKTYTATYTGKPAKKISALDYHCAVKQSAYWFGCSTESSRLEVREDDTPLSAGAKQTRAYLTPGAVVSDSVFE